MPTVRAQTPFARLNIIDYDEIGWEEPLNENHYIIDALISQFTKFHNIRGLWKRATQYTTNDVVIDAATGAMWKALATHNSTSTGLFADDRVLALWTAVTDPDIGNVDTFVTPESFGLPGFDEDQSPAVQASLQYAIDNGRAWRGDARYHLMTPIVVNITDDAKLNALGGDFLVDFVSGGIAIRVVNNTRAVYAVTLSATTINLGNNQPPGASSFATTQVALPSGHGVKKGDVVRILSDDRGQQDTEDRFSAEFSQVVQVVGDNAYLAAPLKRAYTTNPRMVVYNAAGKLSWSDVKFTSDPVANEVQSRKVVYLQMEGFVAPAVNRPHMTNITAIGINALACLAAIGNDLHFNNGRNATGSEPGVAGYGWQDTGSELTLINGIHGRNMRHSYTTIQPTTDVSNVYTYGEVFGAIVANGSDFGSSAAGFDTHAGSKQCSFINLTTSNSYIGESSAKAGFQLRGSEHTILNCRHTGGGNGIVVLRDYDGSYTQHTIDGFRYQGIDQAIRSDNPDRRVFLTLKNFDAISSADHLIRLNNTELFLQNATLDARGATPTALIYSTGPCTVRAIGDGNVYKFDQSDGASRICSYTGFIDAIIEGRVVSGDKNWNSAVRSDDVSPDATSYIRVDLESNRLPTAAYNGLFNNGNSDQGGVIRAREFINRSNSAVWELQINAADMGLDLLKSSAERIVIRGVCTTSGRTIAAIDAGYFAGQQLFILNDGSSTQSFDVLSNHGGNIDIPASVTLAPKSGLALVWNDFDWVGVSNAVSVTGGTGVTDHGALTGLGDDDHAQYHNDARALTWLQGRSVVDFGDVPALVANRFLKVNAGATAIEMATNPVPGPLQALSTLLDDYFFFRNESSQPRFRINNAADITKVEMADDHVIIGGARAERVGTELLTVKGAIYAEGGVNSGVVASDWQNPALIGDIYIWDGGAGSLRVKATTAPTSAGDGSPLGIPVVRTIKSVDGTANSASFVAASCAVAVTPGTYKLRGQAIYQSTVATSGITIRLLAGGGMTAGAMAGIARTIVDTSSPSGEQQNGFNSMGSGLFSGAVNTINVNVLAMLDATIVVTVGGTIDLEFRPEITDGSATATLKAGTFLEVEKIA